MISSNASLPGWHSDSAVGLVVIHKSKAFPWVADDKAVVAVRSA
jgi:hypothetical protein